MNDKHTEGPWTIKMPGKGKCWAKISGNGWQNLAKVVVRTKDEDDENIILTEEIGGRANAQLIATAPDMLEMLLQTKELLEPLKNNPASQVFMERLNNVIKTATTFKIPKDQPTT